MRRNIRKYYTLTRKEAEDLKKKAKKTCRSEAGLVRELITGFEPREKPGDEFYEAMAKVSSMTDNLELILNATDKLSEEIENLLGKEIKRWRKFQADIERRFLSPDDGVMKWQ